MDDRSQSLGRHLDFMVISMPRSGSAWLSNWLTTETSLCIHEPLHEHYPLDWDVGIAPTYSGLRGVACTGIWMYPEFLKNHPARKVIVHRPKEEINKSLRALGVLETLEVKTESMLWAPEGMHVTFSEILKDSKVAKKVYEFLLEGKEFEQNRFNQLVKLNVQRDLDQVELNPEVVKRMLSDRQRALSSTAFA